MSRTVKALAMLSVLALDACGGHGGSSNPSEARDGRQGDLPQSKPLRGDDLLLAEQPLRVWIAALNADDGGERVRATRSLIAALRAESDGEQLVRFSAVVDPLVLQLADADPRVRAATARALSQLQLPTDSARPALPSTTALIDRALHDADVDVRCAALQALARIAAPPGALAEALDTEGILARRSESPSAASRDALSAVESCLGDPNTTVTVQALDCIGMWGRHGQHLAPKVAMHLRSPHPAVRSAAVSACGLILAPSELIVSDLLEVVRNPSGQRSEPAGAARRKAVNLIVHLRLREAIPTLRTLGNDPDVGAQVHDAIQALEGDAR